MPDSLLYRVITTTYIHAGLTLVLPLFSVMNLAVKTETDHFPFDSIRMCYPFARRTYFYRLSTSKVCRDIMHTVKAVFFKRFWLIDLLHQTLMTSAFSITLKFGIDVN